MQDPYNRKNLLDRSVNREYCLRSIITIILKININQFEKKNVIRRRTDNKNNQKNKIYSEENEYISIYLNNSSKAVFSS